MPKACHYGFDHFEGKKGLLNILGKYSEFSKMVQDLNSNSKVAVVEGWRPQSALGFREAQGFDSAPEDVCRWA